MELLHPVISAKSRSICIIISSDLGAVQHPPLLSLTSLPLSNTPLSLMCLSPRVLVFLPLLMFLLSLFPPPLKCRNPSTAFYQAFRPSRLRGSKPVNDRYELGCVYVCVCGLACLAKPDLHPLNLEPWSLCTLQHNVYADWAVYVVLECHFSENPSVTTVKKARHPFPD